jgi:hypothetical protein
MTGMQHRQIAAERLYTASLPDVLDDVAGCGNALSSARRRTECGLGVAGSPREPRLPGGIHRLGPRRRDSLPARSRARRPAHQRAADSPGSRQAPDPAGPIGNRSRPAKTSRTPASQAALRSRAVRRRPLLPGARRPLGHGTAGTRMRIHLLPHASRPHPPRSRICRAFHRLSRCAAALTAPPRRRPPSRARAPWPTSRRHEDRHSHT